MFGLAATDFYVHNWFVYSTRFDASARSDFRSDTYGSNSWIVWKLKLGYMSNIFVLCYRRKNLSKTDTVLIGHSHIITNMKQIIALKLYKNDKK